MRPIHEGDIDQVDKGEETSMWRVEVECHVYGQIVVHPGKGHCLCFGVL